MSSKKPIIHDVSWSTGAVEQWSKLEISVDLSASFSNPYDYDDIHLKGVFIDPMGKVTSIDGFYMQQFELTDANRGEISALNQNTFVLRFSPTLPGQWRFDVELKTAEGLVYAKGHTFNCTAAKEASNHGFVQGLSLIHI